MKPISKVCSIAALIVLLSGTPGQAQESTQQVNGPKASADISTRFTYQGRLVKHGQAVTDDCDMNFSLYDAVTGGSQVLNTLTLSDVLVSAGLFTVGLDFGADAFNGNTRWLATEVKCGAETNFAVLQPRQEMTAAPYALFSSNTGSLRGRTIQDTAPTSGQALKWNGSVWAPGADWNLTGNAGITASNFLGTTDNAALELRVNNQRVLRLEPNATSPNLIGGSSWNTVTVGVHGATISGGGSQNNPNRVTAGYATIGGGYGNAIRGTAALVGGGISNTASGTNATVGGGNVNTASGWSTTVGGGETNTASQNYATVSGGGGNTANHYGSTVGGGLFNTASGDFSYVAGHRATATQPGTFVWADSIDLDFNPSASPGPQGITNSFNIRATGGVYLVTGVDNSGTPTNGLYVSGGGSGWNSYSNRDAKTNFTALDSNDVLSRLAGIPVQIWSYKAQNAPIRHIGPMAQDFNAAFGVGEPDKAGQKLYLNSLDVDGVALAGIQGLYQLYQAQTTRITTLESKVNELTSQKASQQAQLDTLQQRLDKLEKLLGATALANNTQGATTAP